MRLHYIYSRASTWSTEMVLAASTEKLSPNTSRMLDRLNWNSALIRKYFSNL